MENRPNSSYLVLVMHLIKIWSVGVVLSLLLQAEAQVLADNFFQNDKSSIVVAMVNSETSNVSEIQNTLGTNWTGYENTRYHYHLSIPPSARVGSMDIEVPTPHAPVIYIVIDPLSDPVYVCAGDNVRSWSSKELFEQWKDNPPVTKSDEFECGEYPPYAKWNGSSFDINGIRAFQVKIFRGPTETVITYIATKKSLLAVALPPEDPKSQSWQGHFDIYQRIITSLNILNRRE